MLVSEPFWREEPDPEYLAWSGVRREGFGTHASNVQAGVAEGLMPLLALVSNGDDWDFYETLQWRAAARYAAANPHDPDVPELLDRVSRSRHEYSLGAARPWAGRCTSSAAGAELLRDGRQAMPATRAITPPTASAMRIVAQVASALRHPNSPASAPRVATRGARASRRVWAARSDGPFSQCICPVWTGGAHPARSSGWPTT